MLCLFISGGGPVAEPYLADNASVAFDLTPISTGNDSIELICTYAAQGKLAKFRIEFRPDKAIGGGDAAGLNIKFGKGSIDRTIAKTASSRHRLGDRQRRVRATRTTYGPGMGDRHP